MDGNARPCPGILPDAGGFLDPAMGLAEAPQARGECSMEATVSEIHGYPLRPPGFAEPLFPNPESRREVAEHLAHAPWLSRASQMLGAAGDATCRRVEPVVLRHQPRSRQVTVVRPRAGRCSWRRRRVIEVVARWREVRLWWDEDTSVDRVLFRVAVSGGGVVDLALERTGGWSLVGVVD